MAKKTTIRCPYCNCEYLPGEIYFPKSFLGQPSNIIKDEKGTILGYDGEDMQTSEEFVCEKCDKKFTVDASVTFKTNQTADVFDDEEYTTKVTRPNDIRLRKYI